MRDGELAYVEVLLTAWGLWSLKDFSRPGYSHHSIIARLMREGAAAAAIKRLRLAEIPSSPAIEATEAAIVTMPAPLRAAIKTRYLNPDWPSRVCAQELGLTPQGFAMTVNRGQWWLAGRLSA